MILFESLNEIDAFEDIGNVVNPPLLHAENLHSFVQVKTVIVCVDESLDEFLGQLDKPVLFPASLAAILIQEAFIFEWNLPTQQLFVPRMLGVDTRISLLMKILSIVKLMVATDSIPLHVVVAHARMHAQSSSELIFFF